jgi:hypothetical protein
MKKHVTQLMIRQARRTAVADGYTDYGDGTFMRIDVVADETGDLFNLCSRLNCDGTPMSFTRTPRVCVNSARLWA